MYCFAFTLLSAPDVSKSILPNFPLAILLATLCSQLAWAQLTSPVPLEEPPIEYSRTSDDNRVSKLAAALRAGTTTLVEDENYGFLPAILQALEIPPASQTLVFSKTSLQIRHISPRNPRAIYFNDDTYLGWVRGSSLMELSTTDPKLGAAFYLLDTTGSRPRIKRAGYDCLGCHATSMTQNVPGHALRSVMANGDGRVETRHKSYLTELKTPFEQRFGGWYVTGNVGSQKHLGNAFVRGESIDLSRQANIDLLEHEFDTNRYLSPHSDVVALLVLAHQVEMHNALTKADFQIRRMIHDESSGKTKLLPEERKLILRQIASGVVSHLLFSNELPLAEPIEGRQEFQSQFTSRSLRDKQGRSLKDFDLKTRLFRYPCSFLIYSDAFTNLTDELRHEVLRVLQHTLTDSPNAIEASSHLDQSTKKAIHEILLDTHSEFRELATAPSP